MRSLRRTPGLLSRYSPGIVVSVDYLYAYKDEMMTIMMLMMMMMMIMMDVNDQLCDLKK